MARRVKCVILYATETGTSEGFAKTLCKSFKHAFDAKVLCMDEYDVSRLGQEALVLIVTSTFGNGDPPGNGKAFSKHINEMQQPDHQSKLTDHGSNMQTKSWSDGYNDTEIQTEKTSVRNLALDSWSLRGVRFSVFGLGSSAYPNFCAFANHVDTMFHDLGAERICRLSEGDELCDQKESFRIWARDTFQAACDTFCIGDQSMLQGAAGSLSAADNTWSHDRFRVTPSETRENDIITALSNIHGKTVYPCKFIGRTQLQSSDSDRQTMLIKLDTVRDQSEMMYVPGDHVAIFPENSQSQVDTILMKLDNAPSPDQTVKLEMNHDTNMSLGYMQSWGMYSRIPPCTLRTAFSRFLDVTTPPSKQLLSLLTEQATNDFDRDSMKHLATNSQAYEKWKKDTCPTIAHVFDQFPSLKVPPSLLLSNLPLLKPRYYSISSSLKYSPAEINVTVAVIKSRTKLTGQNDPLHEGVCSTWLSRVDKGSIIPCYIKQDKAFHMPDDPSLPMILVSAGTCIAPFRSFWQQRKIDKDMSPAPQSGSRKGWGDIYLYFGCRNSQVDDIFKEELAQMKKEGVLTKIFKAFSREPDNHKTYVQTLLKHRATNVHQLLALQNGHLYVCGTVNMVYDVMATLEEIFRFKGEMDMQDARKIVSKLRENNRIHVETF